MRIEDYVLIRIEVLCNKYGMTRYKLSQKTGISQTTLTNIFKKRNLPSIITIERICDAFGISIAQFFAEEEGLDLSNQQKELLERWDLLNLQEREFIMTIMINLKKNE